jgi:hypothetical protein
MQLYAITDQDTGKLLDIVIDNEINSAPDNSDFRLIEVKTLDECDEFDIIENDDDKEYGLSYVSVRGSYDDERLDCLMHQRRMKLNPGEPYSEAAERVNESNKSYYEYVADSEAAVAAHLDFWIQDDKELEQPCSRRIYCFTDEEVTMLLNKGFPANRLLIELQSYSGGM